MACWSCMSGMHTECYSDTGDCCCSEHTPIALEDDSKIFARKLKEDEDVVDPTSAGRKRAVKMFPIPTVEEGGMLCEWAGLKLAGGGPVPIVGCSDNIIVKTKARVEGFSVGTVHHGPDKATLNNNAGNVHRICSSCHNRWHAVNDPFYGERPDAGATYIPLSGDVSEHNSTDRATKEDVERSNTYWSLSKTDRANIDYQLVVRS